MFFVNILLISGKKSIVWIVKRRSYSAWVEIVLDMLFFFCYSFKDRQVKASWLSRSLPTCLALVLAMLLGKRQCLEVAGDYWKDGQVYVGRISPWLYLQLSSLCDCCLFSLLLILCFVFLGFDVCRDESVCLDLRERSSARKMDKRSDNRTSNIRETVGDFRLFDVFLPRIN